MSSFVAGEGNVTSWDPQKSLGQTAKWLCIGKNSTGSQRKAKKSLLDKIEGYTLHRQNADLLRRWEQPQGMGGHLRRWEGPWALGSLAFMGWITLYANEWKEYSCYFGEGQGFPRNWVTAHFFCLLWFILKLSQHKEEWSFSIIMKV